MMYSLKLKLWFYRSGGLLLLLSLWLALWCLPVAAQVKLEGPLVQGGLVFGYTTPGAKVWQNNQPVRISDDGVFLIGFDRDMPNTSLVKVKYPDGRLVRKTLTVQQRKYAIQKLTLPKHKAAPITNEDIYRTWRELGEVQKARQRDDDRQDFAEGFIWPLTGPITGVYGSQRIINGKKKQPHYGVDIARPTGTPVVAPAAGLITLAEPDLFYSGGTILIDHGHQLTSSLLHLSKLKVKVGDRVRKGQVIGEVGATGRATGPHLDWRMKLRKYQVDPQMLVPPMPKTAQ